MLIKSIYINMKYLWIFSIFADNFHCPLCILLFSFNFFASRWKLPVKSISEISRPKAAPRKLKPVDVCTFWAFITIYLELILWRKINFFVYLANILSRFNQWFKFRAIISEVQLLHMSAWVLLHFNVTDVMICFNVMDFVLHFNVMDFILHFNAIYFMLQNLCYILILQILCYVYTIF